MINVFSLKDRVNKGIDIRGKLGDKVRAAADGVVVYAGGGLRGYGKLVIGPDLAFNFAYVRVNLADRA